jgi:biopolymer transport protein ExbD
LIVLFFSLLSSRFVFAPGISLSLPTTARAPGDIVAASSVLTVSEIEGREMLIFNGGIFTLETLQRAFDERERTSEAEILLVRLDQTVSMQLLVRVCELAEFSGFSRVQIAAKPEKAPTRNF